MLNKTGQNIQMQNYFKQLENIVLLKSQGYRRQTEKYKRQSLENRFNNIFLNFRSIKVFLKIFF